MGATLCLITLGRKRERPTRTVILETAVRPFHRRGPREIPVRGLKGMYNAEGDSSFRLADQRVAAEANGVLVQNTA